MDEAGERRRITGSKGCGCLAAVAFLLIVGLPVLFIFSFGLSPCEDGPCSPNGARDLRQTAAVLLALALLLGAGIWQLTGWWARRQAARGIDGRRQLELASTALLLLVGAALLALVLL